jgi:hypothetical protein
VWAEISGSLNAVADRLRSVRRRMAGRHPDYLQPLQRPTAASAEPLQAALTSVFYEFDRMAATAREYLVEASGEWPAARVVMTLDDPDRTAAMLGTCYRLAGFKQLHAAIGRRIESLQAREAARLQATQEEAAA